MLKNREEDIETTAAGIHISLPALIALRATALHTARYDANKKLQHTGLKLTRVRGRGIEFDATREYQAGDDLRSMAWRVTARSLKPHIKVYREERERPVWLAVDLSPSLYFGTRTCFKSVCSIRQAAILGWSYLLKRERIGALIATEEKSYVYQPQANERNFLTILNTFATASLTQPHFNEKNQLMPLLQTAQREVRAGNLLFILSDFFQFDDAIKKQIVHLSQRAQVVLFFVYDPFEAEPPPPHPYVLTNGQEKIVFNMDNAHNRQAYQQQFLLKQKHLKEFAQKYHLPLHILRTDETKL